MEAIDLGDLYGVNNKVSVKYLKPFPREKTEKGYLDNYDEPMYFFKGVVLGLLFCLPIWTILIWLIT
jgi:hypothetical protein